MSLFHFLSPDFVALKWITTSLRALLILHVEPVVHIYLTKVFGVDKLLLRPQKWNYQMASALLPTSGPWYRVRNLHGCCFNQSQDFSLWGFLWRFWFLPPHFVFFQLLPKLCRIDWATLLFPFYCFNYGMIWGWIDLRKLFLFLSQSLWNSNVN